MRNLSLRPTRGWHQGRRAVSAVSAPPTQAASSLGASLPRVGGRSRRGASCCGVSLPDKAVPPRPSAHPDLSPHGQGWGGHRRLALVSATVTSVYVHIRARVHPCVCVCLGRGPCTSFSAWCLRPAGQQSPSAWATAYKANRTSDVPSLPGWPPPPQVPVESHSSGNVPRTDNVSSSRVCGWAPSACVWGGSAVVPTPRPRSPGEARAQQGFPSVRTCGAPRRLSSSALLRFGAHGAHRGEEGHSNPARAWRSVAVKPARVQ